MQMGKLIIFTSLYGNGKKEIINHLLEKFPKRFALLDLQKHFSVNFLLEEIWNNKQTAIIDIDIESALKFKEFYNYITLLIFVFSPIIRNMERNGSSFAQVEKATEEFEKGALCDYYIFSEDIAKAKLRAEEVTTDFLNGKYLIALQ